jgi:hypothetical protein
MYVDSSPVTSRRFADTLHLRSARREATSEIGNRTKVARRRPASATETARRTRVTDAIVSQWLLDQVPAEHRHALRSASDLRR